MSRSVSSSLKWLRPFIGGLGESLSDKMMTSSSSGDGGRFSLFILLHIRGRMKCQYILNLSTDAVCCEHKTGLYQFGQNYSANVFFTSVVYHSGVILHYGKKLSLILRKM